MTTLLELTCRDPIVSRDGRPFGAGQGNRMRSAGWPLPSMVAGSLRSTIGKAAQRDFYDETAHEIAQDLLQMEVAGAFPVADGQLYLPAPRDCVLHRTKGPLRATPQPFDNSGCDFPLTGLLPVGLTEAQTLEEFKPSEAPAWWPLDRYSEWLSTRDIEGVNHFVFNNDFLCHPGVDNRMHVQLDPVEGVARDEHLFTTTALSLTHLPHYDVNRNAAHKERFAAITLTVRMRANGWCANAAVSLDTLHPLGGERRLVHWKATTKAPDWRCPREIREVLSSATKVRMVLATPAVFGEGWKPAWLDEKLIGKPPGTNVILKLVGVTIERWRAVSGWSLAELPNQRRGPKPVKRIVPAGGVYFFEAIDGLASDLAKRWLEPVSDDEQDRRDGFGLTIWGIW